MKKGILFFVLVLGPMVFAGFPPGTKPHKTAPVHLVNGTAGPTGVFRNSAVSARAAAVLFPITSGPNLTANYAGLNFNQSGGFVPPDTCGAAGPSNYIETVNQEIAIYSSKRTGATSVLDSLDHFFFTVGGLSPVTPSSSRSDPITIYDELIGRFIIGDQDVDFNTHVSNFLIAVSKTSNPSTLKAEDWNFYTVSTTEAGYDADYPGNFGYNADAFVFTLNMFPVVPGANHVRVTSVNTTDLANGVAQLLLHTFNSDMADFSVRPATMHGSAIGDPMWLVTEHGDNTSIDVIKMTNVLSNTPTYILTNLAVTQYSTVTPPLNPDGSVITFNIDSRILKAAVANNQLVATHHVSPVGSTTQAVVQWYRIDLSSGTPALADLGRISAGNNTYLSYPAIDINSSGSIGMTYMRSGTDTSTDYMSMYITGRTPSDVAGTMETPVLVPAGTGQANYSDFNGGRAGDLSGINVDPADIGSFWAANEYATSNAGSPPANWGTAIANFTIGTLPQALAATINDSVTGTGFNQFEYVGPNWHTAAINAATGAYQNDEHYAFVTDTLAHFRFNGTQVKIYTVKEAVGGNISYRMDNGPEVIISNYAATSAGNQLSYDSGIIMNGPHDLVIKVKGSHEDAAGSNTITIDKAEVYVPAGDQVLAATINDSVTGNGVNQFEYVGPDWHQTNVNPATGAYQNDEHYAFVTNTLAHFRFIGSQVKIYTTKEPVGGNISYSIDNGPETLEDNYAPTSMGNQLSFTSGTLDPNMEHDLVIKVKGTHGMGSSNTITIDKAEVYAPGQINTPPAINDTVTGTGNSQFEYVGPDWHTATVSNSTGAYNNDEHYAFVTNTLAHFRFHGTQVKIYTVKEPVGGNIGYTLDGGGEQVVSNYAATSMGQQLSYTSPVMAMVDHDLIIRVVGSHEPAASSNTITIDKAEVYTGP